MTPNEIAAEITKQRGQKVTNKTKKETESNKKLLQIISETVSMFVTETGNIL